VAPNAVGFGGATYWGGMPFTDYPNAYVGMITILLAIPAVFARGTPRLFALALALVSLAIAMGRYVPLYGFLYDHMPLFNKFRVPVMIVLLFQLAAALGLAWGWSAVLEGAEGRTPPRRLSRTLTILAAVLGVGLLISVLGQEGCRAGYVAGAAARRPEIPAQALEMAYQGYVGDLLRVCFLGLAAVGLALLALRGSLAARWASLGVLVLMLIELWPVSNRVMAPVVGPRTARVLDQGRDDVVQYLEQAAPPGSFRVLPLAEFQSNRFSGFRVASVGGYHAAKPRRFQDLMDAQAVQNPAWWRLLNVRFLISPEPLQIPGLAPTFRGASGLVYEVPTLPRATVVGAYRVAPARAILDSISSGATDPAQMAWLEEDPRLALGPVTGARAEIASYGLHQVVVDVETPGPALLRLADLWYPDWHARVDGRPAPILRADYLLRAVAVPAGRHRVEFRYQSAAVRAGLVMSLVSLTLSLALLGAGWLQHRRRRGMEARS
jgi:hypothetical protein